MSSTGSPSGATVSVTLLERAFVCPTGGGFETERWKVHVNDGWMPLSVLVWRKAVGEITAELLDEDDPGRVGGSRWSDRGPQQWFQRRTHVEAPIGTRLWRRTWRPVRDPNRLLEYPLPQRVIDEYFEVRKSGIVSERVLAQRAAEREARRRTEAAPQLSAKEQTAFAATLLSQLGGEPAPAPPVEPSLDPPVEGDRPAPRFRKPMLVDRRMSHEPPLPAGKDKAG